MTAKRPWGNGERKILTERNGDDHDAIARLSLRALALKNAAVSLYFLASIIKRP